MDYYFRIWVHFFKYVSIAEVLSTGGGIARFKDQFFRTMGTLGRALTANWQIFRTRDTPGQSTMGKEMEGAEEEEAIVL